MTQIVEEPVKNVAISFNATIALIVTVATVMGASKMPITIDSTVQMVK
jgi:hypothetical protein